MERTSGSLRFRRGLRSGFAGFVFAEPSRIANLKKLRSDASLREIVLLA
ncbi:hypothetical protein RRSWK_06474 [Rhodopirellula sp. SWK7]|nr:hypothetical protein RRSWK_06474 [Rhodopirellula sp. SWK7]